jgi:hypothetical protein
MKLISHHSQQDLEIICPRICLTAEVMSYSFQNFLSLSCSFEYGSEINDKEQDLANEAVVELK